MSNQWYDKYMADVCERAKNVKPKEVEQHVLHLKAIGSKALENGDDCYTFRSGDKFGFSERFVNQLMQFAFDQGRKDIDKESFAAGYDQCWKEVLDKLGIDETE